MTSPIAMKSLLRGHIIVAWENFKEGDSVQFNSHQINYWNGQIHVFSGNGNRNFPVPSGWRLVKTGIGLVDTNPKNQEMALPEGRVDVHLPSGELLTVGDVVPNHIDIVTVKTPLTKGCSNWAGPFLIFQKATITSKSGESRREPG